MSLYTFVDKPRLYLCWVAKRVEPSEEGRENEFITLSQPIGHGWLRAGFEKRVPNPAKKGRENELLYFRG
jgi:hypothetical protein